MILKLGMCQCLVSSDVRVRACGGQAQPRQVLSHTRLTGRHAGTRFFDTWPKVVKLKIWIVNNTKLPSLQ